jgi:di/tricarboxylate transporter
MGFDRNVGNFAPLMESLDWQGWFTLEVIALILLGMVRSIAAPDLIMMGGLFALALFELAPVGIPICIVGLGYLLFIAPPLLPSRLDPAADLGRHRREYTVAMIVEPSCPLIGENIEVAGLRNLPGLFLFGIQRNEHVITPVAPEEVIAAGDRVVSTIVDLQRIRGLVPAGDEDEPARGSARHRLYEAVVSRSSPLVNRSIKGANFRTAYYAAVIGVHRGGERIPGKIGDIVLRAGDTLVFQAATHFVETHGNNPHFYLVSEVPGSHAPRHERAWFAISVFVVTVVLAAAEIVPISIGSFVAAGILIGARCLSGQMARSSVHMTVLVVIAAGLGIATAIEKTGTASAIAPVLVSQFQVLGPVAVLTPIYLVTMLMSELLHHAASAALMFPVAMAAAQQAYADPRPS